MILPLQGAPRAKSLEVSMVFALWLVLGLPSAVNRGSEEKKSGDWGQEEERGQGQSWVFRVLEGCHSYDEISIREVVFGNF